MSKTIDNLEIDNQTIARFWLFPFGFALTCMLIYWMRDGLILVAISLFLAIAINPLVSLISKKLFDGKERVASTAISFSIVLIVLGLFVTLLAPVIVQQTTDFIQSAPDTISKTIRDVTKFVDDNDRFNIKPLIDEYLTSIDKNKQEWAKNAGKSLFTGVSSVLSTLASIFIVLTLTFMLLLELPHMVAYVSSFYGDKKRLAYHKSIARKMYYTVSSFVSGQLIVAFFNGLMASLMVFILSLIFDTPVGLMTPIGVIVGLMGLVPMIGSTLGSIIGSIILALSNILAAIVFLIYCIFYQQIENNVIEPAVQSKKVNVSGLIVLVSVTLGIYVLGLAGGVVAIPLAGCIKILIEEFIKSRNLRFTNRRRLANSDPENLD